MRRRFTYIVEKLVLLHLKDIAKMFSKLFLGISSSSTSIMMGIKLLSIPSKISISFSNVQPMMLSRRYSFRKLIANSRNYMKKIILKVVRSLPNKSTAHFLDLIQILRQSILWKNESASLRSRKLLGRLKLIYWKWRIMLLINWLNRKRN